MGIQLRIVHESKRKNHFLDLIAKISK